MASHYLFFEPKNSLNLIDVLRPRQKLTEKIKPFRLDLVHECKYGDLVYFVMDDAQRQKIRGEFRESQENRPPIYTLKDMVTADLVDFTSEKLEPGIRAFRADFFSPVRREQFAYATPYGKGTFAIEMKKRKDLDLEMLPLVDCKIGDPIGKVIQSVFATYHLGLIQNSNMWKYQGRDLALVVPSKLIEREN